MGNKKVDMVEVHAFSDVLQQISLDMHSQLEKVIKSIDTIQGMSSFSGKAAKDAKRYFQALHVTVLTAFQGLFEDLEANVKQHIKTFESEVDDSETAIITSHYLHEVREDIEETFEKITNEDETIHDIISEVSDLTSAKSPDFSDVNEWQKKAVKATKELEEDISSFSRTGNETDVQAIMQQIETVMSKAKGSTGKASFEGFEGISSIDALRKLTDYNEEKLENVPKELTENNIDEMSISDIGKSHEMEMGKLKDEAAIVLKSAFNDLKAGKIDRATYLSIWNGLKHIADGAKEEVNEIDIPQELVNYVDENEDRIINVSKTVAGEGLKFSGIIEAYGLRKKGFEIKRYKTKGGMVGYRVYNPQVAGIQRPGKNKPRSHKIYYKHNIDHHAYKKKSSGRVPITDKVKPGSGAVSALKSKAGWAGIAIDAGFNIKDNIQEGESTQRIVGDATVDVVAGVGTIAAAGAATAFVVGSFGAPILVGAIAGWGVTKAADTILNFKWGENGKKTSDILKDGVQAGANAVKSVGKTVAGWFK